MKYHFKKVNKQRPAFSLVESVTALIILALISSSAFVVIDRSMASAADSVLKMQAFELARNNMETLLTLNSIAENTEYGTSEIYPDIQWETTVETFSAPANDGMWIQAICSAEYIDSAGQTQTIELTSWITGLTKNQLVEIAKEEARQGQALDDDDLKTDDDIADDEKPQDPDKPEEKDPQSDPYKDMTPDELVEFIKKALSGK
ncbi:MAG: type IV pilus modification PilV family protein [Planctomycetota bacterium]